MEGFYTGQPVSPSISAGLSSVISLQASEETVSSDQQTHNLTQTIFKREVRLVKSKLPLFRAEHARCKLQDPERAYSIRLTVEIAKLLIPSSRIIGTDMIPFADAGFTGNLETRFPLKKILLLF